MDRLSIRTVHDVAFGKAKRLFIDTLSWASHWNRCPTQKLDQNGLLKKGRSEAAAAVALLREYCPNVAGGQLDLEHKYVKHVPLPDLSRQFKENPTLPVLANSIRSRYP